MRIRNYKSKKRKKRRKPQRATVLFLAGGVERDQGLDFGLSRAGRIRGFVSVRLGHLYYKKISQKS